MLWEALVADDTRQAARNRARTRGALPALADVTGPALEGAVLIHSVLTCFQSSQSAPCRSIKVFELTVLSTFPGCRDGYHWAKREFHTATADWHSGL